jgi:phosphatidylglycerophosphate synthase
VIVIVKVYLLLDRDGQFFFYSDESETDDSQEEDPTSAAGGLRSWLHEHWRRFASALHESDAKAARWARRVWDWMHSRVRPDESMLVRLRSTRRIDLYHPASQAGLDVTAVWQGYLTRRLRQHMVSLGYNTLVAPVALLFLWTLPGPNIIGYWFAYRAVHHWLIVRGIQRVRHGAIPTRAHADAKLDAPVHRDPQGKARHDALCGSGHRLDDYLSKGKLRAWLQTSQDSPHEPGRALTSIGEGPEHTVATPSDGGSGISQFLQFVLPNALSLLRIGLALSFPWIPSTWRFGWIVLAALSDFFDGRLSRALHGASGVGQILDPVADKLFVGIVLWTLLYRREVTIVEVLLVGFRDLAVLCGSAWTVLRRGIDSLRQMPPTLLGKLATAGQFGFLLLLSLEMRAWSSILFRLAEEAAVTFSVIAGIDYLSRKRDSDDRPCDS